MKQENLISRDHNLENYNDHIVFDYKSGKNKVSLAFKNNGKEISDTRDLDNFKDGLLDILAKNVLEEYYKRKA